MELRKVMPSASALLALAALLALSSRFSMIETLSPDGLFASRALYFFLGSTVVLFLCSRRASEQLFRNLLWTSSLIGCLFLFGWKEGLAVFCLPALWLSLMHLSPGFPFRLALSACGLGLLVYFRKQGYESLWLWWVAGQWLRCFAVTFDWKKSQWSGEALSLPALRDASLHFCAPPFLLSPVPMEWISFAGFRESLDGKKESAVPWQAGKLLWVGVAFLFLHAFCRAYVEPFRSEAWDFARLTKLDGEGWFHLKAGWTFLLLRLWQYCGLTALVAGSWQLMGVYVRYDFDRPLFSRNGLDFWRRYHNYGREFLLRNIFYPMAFFLSRRLPWTWSASIAGVFVFLMIVVVQATSLVPIAGIPLSATFSWMGSIKHTFWSVVFIALSTAFSSMLGKTGLPEKMRAPVEVAFTLLLLGWLFFNSFSQLWMNNSHFDFLRAVLSW